ncbi:hypothetical protein Esi_0063_0121 [Ectocarpus siliculosus]|uniref:Thioredoxin domain-containing protein n=1 Tax=Ectocarpus siliculosus TaxID=2880 RepID=D7G5C2_ECTSI|nr:hypothetical protein Esi_0063_0121 [Ectocarpus siliculosus]|eukprot:CBJ27276.1 hypothetical protein Esi_0063_0121 [Ectocarpus siliculosus]
MVFWRLLLGTLLIYAVPLHARSRASLFEFVDQVTELSPSTFSDVAASSVPWVLDCYSPGCPHCVRFAPTQYPHRTNERIKEDVSALVDCESPVRNLRARG